MTASKASKSGEKQQTSRSDSIEGLQPDRSASAQVRPAQSRNRTLPSARFSLTNDLTLTSGAGLVVVVFDKEDWNVGAGFELLASGKVKILGPAAGKDIIVSVFCEFAGPNDFVNPYVLADLSGTGFFAQVSNPGIATADLDEHTAEPTHDHTHDAASAKGVALAMSPIIRVVVDTEIILYVKQVNAPAVDLDIPGGNRTSLVFKVLA